MRSWLVCLGASLLFGCRSAAVEARVLEVELLAVHAAVLRDHRELDWRSLTGAESNADVTLSVSRGQVQEMPRRAVQERFQGYFAGARFSRYDDLAPPIVRVSEDGTLGWVIANVRVEGVFEDPAGESRSLASTLGWIELYERSGGRWLRVGTVSNLDRNTSPGGLAGGSYLVDAECAQVLTAAEEALGGQAALAAV
ncbi:MAG: hypothetical protein ACI9HE_002993 [Planctomycetota bacterium]